MMEESEWTEEKKAALLEALAKTAGIFSAEDFPEWATAEGTAAWVRAFRAAKPDCDK
jgi:predicted TIM-barrel fold metal-dependent hydrolase